ncbi:redox-sensing transcriptional repressor Rex [Gemmatimonadota bacterium]
MIPPDESEDRSSGRKRDQISYSTIRRLSRYYRVLESVAEEEVTHISSDQLAQRNGVTSAQVRKDLSYFGTFGKRGLGYPVQELRNEILRILGMDHQWPVVLVGAGNIGRAMIDYVEFRRRGFFIVAGFDVDPKKIGITYKGVPIFPMFRLPGVMETHEVDIGIVAVPALAAQRVCNQLADSGVKGILNFAHTRLIVPPGIKVRTVDMSIEMETLVYVVKNDGSFPLD